MPSERKALLILMGITGSESCWVYFGFRGTPLPRVLRWFGWELPVTAGVFGWLIAAGVAAAYTGYARRLPSVRQSMFRPGLLKAVAVVLAVVSGMCEEGVFRKLWMDGLAVEGHGAAVQVLLSALAFGAVHAVWGLLKGSLRAAAAAMLATSVLGGLLAVAYLTSGRNVLPCVLSHAVINLLIEPGLVLAALRGEMGRPPSPSALPFRP